MKSLASLMPRAPPPDQPRPPPPQLIQDFGWEGAIWSEMERERVTASTAKMVSVGTAVRRMEERRWGVMGAEEGLVGSLARSAMVARRAL